MSLAFPTAKHQTAIRLIGLAASLLIALYLIRQIDLNLTFGRFANLPVLNLLAAFGIYLLLNFLRALRFRLLLGQPDLSIQRLYPIALYHNFLVRILPFKTGELSYIVLLRHYLKQPFEQGLGSLVRARLFDLLLVASSATAGLVLISGQESTYSGLVLGLVICLGFCAVSLYFSGALLRKVIDWSDHFARRGTRLIARLVVPMEQKLTTLAQQFDQIRRPRFFAAALALSLLIYMASASFNLLLLAVLGIRQQFETLLVIISIAMFAEALPFSIAGLGLVEGGWTLGLTVFGGLTTTDAISIGFFLHACQLISVSLSGLLGYCLLNFPGRPSPKPRYEPSVE